MTDLRLRDPHSTDRGLKALSGMKHLEFLVIGGRITDEGLHHLEALTSLRMLGLKTRTVSLEAIRELRSKLPSLHTIQPFDQISELYGGAKLNFAKLGQRAPEFSVTMRDGKRFTLADHAGQAVLVHFWGPKCGPCLRAIPALKALHQDLARRTDRFAMISMAMGMDEPEWRDFLDEHDMDWPQALLRAGWDEKPWQDYHVGFIPDYAVIGPDGQIVADGESTGLDVEKLRAAIVKALEKSVRLSSLTVFQIVRLESLTYVKS